MENSIIEGLLRNVVDVNGLLIPINCIEASVANYTHPLIVWNKDETFSWSFMGSCVGIYYRQKYLLLCTRHQLKNVLNGRSYEDVGLLDRDGSSFCSATGIVFYEEQFNSSESNDLVVFNFTEPCRDKPYMRERFFNVEKCPPSVPFEQIVGIVASGYPTDKQNHDWESRRIAFTKAVITCSLDKRENQSKYSDDIFRLKILNAFSLKHDGMSGGGAFVLQLEGENARGYFAGIILRGGKDNIYILKVGNIFKIIDSWLIET